MGTEVQPLILVCRCYLVILSLARNLEPGWFRVAGAVALSSLAMVAVLFWRYSEIHQWAEASAIARAIRLITLIGFRPLHFYDPVWVKYIFDTVFERTA